MNIEMGFEVKVIHSVNEIPKDDWNKLNSYTQTSHDFLRIFEESNLQGNEPRHILVYKNKKLISFAVFYIQRHILGVV